MARDFTQELDELIYQKRETIDIDQTEFIDFRKAWLALDCHQDVVGHAHIHGKITYRYEPGHDENE